MKLQKVKKLRLFDHGTADFTQGLAVCDEGLAVESTGQYGSTCLIYRSRAGLAETARYPFAADFFAEGICATPQGCLMVLSWRENVAVQWHVQSATVVRTLDYEREGWGICFQGEYYITSDGSSTLTRRRLDLVPFDEVEVWLGGEPLAGLNSLSWSEAGTIWANVYGVDYVVEIDPNSGEVTTLVDATSLREGEHPDADVLNGVCQYAPRSLLLTGKLWARMHEVALESAERDTADLESLLLTMPRLYIPSEMRLLTRGTFRAQRRPP